MNGVIGRVPLTLNEPMLSNVSSAIFSRLAPWAKKVLHLYLLLHQRPQQNRIVYSVLLLDDFYLLVVCLFCLNPINTHSQCVLEVV